VAVNPASRSGSSIFHRVGRYPPSLTHDPRENRLTEITAALLERLDGFPREVVLRLLESAHTSAEARLRTAASDEIALWDRARRRIASQLQDFREADCPRVRVTTQRTTANHNFVDLEMHFLPALFTPGDDFLFWIEVKHGANVHGEQLFHYEQEIGGAKHCLAVVLAPRLDMPHLTGVPEAMPVIDWQAVARLVRDRRRRASPGSGEYWLLREYEIYLTEEGLMDGEALTTEHALALALEPSAADAVARLCEHASAYVQQHWGAALEQKMSGKNPGYGLGYWASYHRARDGGQGTSNWRDSWFEWGTRRDTSRDEARNGWAFFAGATFENKNSPALVQDNQPWLSERADEGFEYVQEWYWRLWRFLYPQQLLATSDIESQSRKLGEWVVESFDLLADHEPPF
jgi:hypothetical protein